MCLVVVFENVPQGCGIILSTIGVDVTSNFCPQSFTNIWENVTKNSALQGKIRSLRLSIALKLGSQQIKLYKGIHL